MSVRKIIRYLPWLFALVFFLLSYQLPFWGDGIASVSKAAVRIWQEGLAHPWNYPDTDPGHPTLFPWLIALGWKIFGFHLWVPHALMALCFGLLIRLLQDWLRLFDEKLQLMGSLLLVLAPLTVSQAVEISLQLPLTLAFFSALYGLKKNKSLLFTLSITALPLIHLQGILLLGVIGLYDLWRSLPLRLSWWKHALSYLLPPLAFGIWLYFHEKEFGWALVTPNYPRESPGLKTSLYYLGLVAWRLLDLGYFVLCIPVLLQLAGRVFKRRLSDIDRLFIPAFLILCVGIPFLFSYPPAHRYFFPVCLLFVPLFLRFLQQKKKTAQVAWLVGALALLLSGNLWYYPGKCLGDQNLVFLGYHTLEKQFMEEYPDVNVVHSFAPLNNNGLYTWLDSNRQLNYRDLYDRNLDSLDWIIESNLNCEFTPELRKEIEGRFVPRTYETYGVYLQVWMNRSLSGRYPDFEGERHQPGRLEKFIRSLREKQLQQTP